VRSTTLFISSRWQPEAVCSPTFPEEERQRRPALRIEEQNGSRVSTKQEKWRGQFPASSPSAAKLPDEAPDELTVDGARPPALMTFGLILLTRMVSSGRGTRMSCDLGKRHFCEHIGGTERAQRAHIRQVSPFQQ
jgi:hypothetical protein